MGAYAGLIGHACLRERFVAGNRKLRSVHCRSPHVCKNGDLNDGGRFLWTYAGILKCNVPVVVTVNSPLPSYYQTGEDIIGLAKRCEFL
jgi:hypothetical protein